MTFNKRAIFSRALYVCEWDGCYKRATDIAHKIPQRYENFVVNYIYNKYSKMISKKEARDILNDELNVAASCREHNDYFSISNNIDECYALIDKILIKDGAL